MSEIRDRLRRLADAARASAEAASDDRQSRDAAIADADEAGLKVTEIADVTGLALSHVDRIIVREVALRQAQRSEST